MIHGQTEVIRNKFPNGQKTEHRRVFCAHCDFWVSEWQWNERHSKHTDLHSTTGAALRIPDLAKPQFMTAGAAR